MGFFKDFEDDFSQAMTELGEEKKTDKVSETLEDIDLAEVAMAEEKRTKSIMPDFDKILENMDEVGNLMMDQEQPSVGQVDTELLSDIFDEESEEKEAAEAAETEEETPEEPEAEMEEEPVVEIEPVSEEEEATETAEMQDAEETAEEEETEEEEDSASAEDSEEEEVQEESMEMAEREEIPAENELTVITRGTTIKGGISADGALDIMGAIEGDVECLGKLTISGNVGGNVIASEIYMDGSRVTGNLSSEGSVKINDGSVVVGDIVAFSAVIAGAVRGDMDVNGPVIIDSSAIVQGNIKAKSIQINNGAVVDGYCSLNYAGVDLDAFFNE